MKSHGKASKPTNKLAWTGTEDWSGVKWKLWKPNEEVSLSELFARKLVQVFKSKICNCNLGRESANLFWSPGICLDLEQML